LQFFGSALYAIVKEAGTFILSQRLLEFFITIGDLTFGMDPLFALFAHHPLLTIGLSMLASLSVDLPAEVAVLVVLVCR